VAPSTTLPYRRLSVFVAYDHDDRTRLGLGKRTTAIRMGNSKPNRDAEIARHETTRDPRTTLESPSGRRRSRETDGVSGLNGLDRASVSR
jgi:hypothetical protein